MIDIWIPTKADVALMQNADWRVEDKMECDFGMGMSPEDAVLKAIDEGHSVHCVTSDNGDLLAVYGFKKMEGHTIIWGIATNAAMDHRIELHRCFKHIVESLTEVCGHLHNYVWAGNFEHIVWLQRLGAYFGEAIYIGKHLFIPFHIQKNRPDVSRWWANMTTQERWAEENRRKQCATQRSL